MDRVTHYPVTGLMLLGAAWGAGLTVGGMLHGAALDITDLAGPALAGLAIVTGLLEKRDGDAQDAGAQQQTGSAEDIPAKARAAGEG